jgi:hypothetical protein
VCDKETTSKTRKKLGKLETLSGGSRTGPAFTCKKNFTRSRTSNGVNPDYAAETKNKEGKSTPRSLRVVAGSENQTSEKLGGKN